MHRNTDGNGAAPVLDPADTGTEDPTFGFRGPGNVEYNLPETIKTDSGDLNVKDLLGYVISSSRKAGQSKIDKEPFIWFCFNPRSGYSCPSITIIVSVD